MKKVFIAICIGVFSINVSSQEKGNFELGGNLGVNFSSLQMNSSGSTEHIIGFNIGATGEYYFSDRWGIKVKLIFDQKGWGNGFLIYPSGNAKKTSYRVSYLTIPVMANLHYGSKRRVYFNFGLYVGFLLNVDAVDVKTNLPLNEILNSTDMGLAIGIGYKFPINKRTKLFFGLDGQLGFTSVSAIVVRNNRNAINNSITARNNRSAINFGVLFSL